MAASNPGAASLRPATPDDLGFLNRVYAASRDREMALVPHWSDAERNAFLDSQFQLQHRHYQTYYPGARFDVIRMNGEDVGRLYVASVSDTEIRLIDIALLPQWRGTGIGTELIRQILADARNAQQFVSLHVEPDNPARQLYRRLGFVDIAEDGAYWLMHWHAD